jgi:hypothetical protein
MLAQDLAVSAKDKITDAWDHFDVKAILPEHAADLGTVFRDAGRNRAQNDLIPAAVDHDSTGVSGGWYRAPGWRASEHASEGAARRRRLLPTEADPFFMGQLQGRLA